MPSLILEGGTFRPIFSAGIMDALLDNDIMFPYCIGVSAGITHCISYVSKQKRRNMNILEKYRNDKRYLSFRNFLKCKSMFGLDFIFDELPNKLDLFDKETFSKYKGKFLIGVTNAETGEEEYLDGTDLDDKCTKLRATCAIPIMFPAIEVDGHKYFDGGLCDPIPISKAVEDGNEKHLILLTRPKGYRLRLEKRNLVACKVLKKKYPKLEKPFRNMYIKYNEAIEMCEKLEAEGKAIILRPTEETAVESFEKNVDKLREGYENGYNLAISRIDDIKKLFAQ
ncbi:MAG: patatin-like phospholipase family protein [Sarcina sp.]